MADYDRTMDVNVRSVVRLTQLCVPHLSMTKGAVVNVSSLAGIRAFSDHLANCMSKAALDQFTRCVALELAPKQVRDNSVNPGLIQKEMLRRFGLNKEEYAKMIQGRVGEVSEVAKTIAFLASPDASFITGALVPLDGGRHLMCPR
ncbi:PREDICTED: L-xylulose reductase-like [Branchiostoma belcheri]|uniref:L-xylulose reductase-like n=1 Tax=Branchiostoma belcheri TaxID=7741 RepID=A0A6P5A0B2_BRABE|nr:PREDICTED: L-xylulose reductase-like [Branchiostoma belcheri]